MKAGSERTWAVAKSLKNQNSQGASVEPNLACSPRRNSLNSEQMPRLEDVFLNAMAQTYSPLMRILQRSL